MAERPVEPTVESMASDWPWPLQRRVWLATRPQFLPASVLPVAVGTAWGARLAGTLDVTALMLALIAVALVHAGSNVLNDVGDELCGTDRCNADRIYPFSGGSRFIQNGIFSVMQMSRLGIALLAAAMAVGLLLSGLYGWPVLLFGVAGIALGSLYSVPPVQLAGRGFGELVVATGFGPLPVAGAAWLQSGQFDPAWLVLSAPVACWVAAILLVNEVPDIAADRMAGKRTLPVRLGVRRTAWLFVALQLAGALLLAGWQLDQGMRAGSLLWPLLLAAGGLRAASGITGGRQALTVSIRMTLAVHTAGCAGLIVMALQPG